VIEEEATSHDSLPRSISRNRGEGGKRGTHWPSDKCDLMDSGEK